MTARVRTAVLPRGTPSCSQTTLGGAWQGTLGTAGVNPALGSTPSKGAGEDRRPPPRHPLLLPDNAGRALVNRASRAGDTSYAHWMLTQKRPPMGGAPSSIVVWRVDVHTADGALCAEGEVGAKVRRNAVATRDRVPEQVTATATTSGPRRRRRRSRTSNGVLPETPAVAAPPAGSAKPERAAGPSRRRRRRRPSSSGAREEEHEPRAAHAPETAPPPAAAAPPAAPSPRSGRPRGLGTVLRRLRGTS